MALRPQSLPPVPEATAAAVQAAFPKGNLYVALRAEFGPLYDDQLFADLYPPQGRPVEVAPWRVALVVVMPYINGSLIARRRMRSVAVWIGRMPSALS
jgi:transposase